LIILYLNGWHPDFLRQKTDQYTLAIWGKDGVESLLSRYLSYQGHLIDIHLIMTKSVTSQQSHQASVLK
jgi:hypothetical protein